MTTAIKSVRLADTIAEYFERLIREGILRPGEKLSAERDLAEKLAVSRPSLRDGIAKLEEQGLLVITKAGTFVAPFLSPFSEPLSILFSNEPRVLKDYFEFRRLVEGCAARLAAIRATPIDRAKISACLESMKASHDCEDPSEESKLDVDLHILIYEAAHNLVLQHTMQVFSDMLRKGILYSREQLYEHPGVRDAFLAQHIAIAETILKGDPAAAEDAARAHIDFTGGTIAAIAIEDERIAASMRRLSRADLLSS
jgi:GntR family transcriptional repressor for pyruvate dehydrogenase complex